MINEKRILEQTEQMKQSQFADERFVTGVAAVEVLIEFAPKVGEWIPCSEDMPAEHESIFARFKGTSKWMKGMFEKCSDDVIVTVKFTDGTRKTMAMHTTDGEWRTSDLPVHHEVTAWMPLPEPYKEGE